MTIKRKKILAYSIVSLVHFISMVGTFLLNLARPIDTLSRVAMTLSVIQLPVHWLYVFIYFRLTVVPASISNEFCWQEALVYNKRFKYSYFDASKSLVISNSVLIWLERILPRIKLMHIGYDTKKGVEYGKLCCSHWVDGKDKKTYINLGRVIDKEKHIFKNRQRGLFQYLPEQDEYLLLDESEYASMPAKPASSLILNFGDAWFLHQYLKNSGLSKCVEAVHCSHKDTVFALVQFYILNQLSLCHARDWYEHSYASILYPQASLSSQRISEQLTQIGSEESYRIFLTHISTM